MTNSDPPGDSEELRRDAPGPESTPIPPGGSDAFFAQVYDELRTVAHARMYGERPGHTLQTTELVHEAYLRLRRGAGAQFQNRKHFFATAAEAMRRILIDRARARRTVKRGFAEAGSPPRKLSLDLAEVAELADDRDPETILALDLAIESLGAEDPRLQETVKLRFYAGLSVEEVADTLGVSPRTVKRDWNYARAWLYERLRTTAGEGG
jgi:RNA polymerase sigma factor (TIGR02999 family)